jgi:hypothetical protein
MKKTTLTLALSAALFGFAGSASAVDMGVTADVGTTGVGAHLVFAMQLNMNARVGVSVLNYNYSGSSSQADYDFKLKLQTFDALLDYFPLNNGFRVTGGLVYNGNKIDANMKPSNGTQYVINGTTYSAAQAGTISGSVDFKKIAPYLGIGWGNPVAVKKGWGFSGDLGVIFQGNPSTTLTSRGCGAPVDCTKLATDVAAEKVNLDNKLSDFKIYPVVRVGAAYGF